MEPTRLGAAITGVAEIYDLDAHWVIDGPEVARVRQRMETVLAGLVNARTDLFLQEKDAARHAALVPEALARAREWAEAGAGCFYPIGLSDPDLVAQVVERSALPVNILVRGGRAEVETMAALGVARISFGPGPLRAAMAWAEAQAREMTGAAPR